jgi:hypothetical protein
VQLITPSTFNITASVYGTAYGCKNESFQYNPKDGTMQVTGLANGTDCIGKIVTVLGQVGHSLSGRVLIALVTRWGYHSKLAVYPVGRSISQIWLAHYSTQCARVECVT